MSPWVYLGVAIVAEVIATSALKESNGFSRLVPSIVVVIGYVVAFYSLGMALRFIPVGIAYAIWAGLGIVLVAGIGWIVFGQKLDAWAVVGMGLVVAGIAVMNLLSTTAAR
jgi:multidrug transporter EmrE-like cation transporter